MLIRSQAVRALLAGTAVVAAGGLLEGCSKHSCLAGTDGCVVDSPCGDLGYTCAPGGPPAEVRVLGPADIAPGGLNALAATKDILLQNDRVTAVIDAIDERHFVATSGGALLDLTVRGQDNDGINHVFQATGLLPADEMRYESMQIVANGPDVAAVQFRGYLFGHKDIPVATRYEVRRCEPGIRIRTEVINNSPDPAMWALLDGFYWSDREMYPFSVEQSGTGFEHPSFDLLTINSAFLNSPFMAASMHSGPPSAYSVTACNVPTIQGFNSKQISGVGLPETTVYPSDYRVYERFIAAAPTRGVSGAIDESARVRSKLFHEKYVKLSGRTVRESGLPVGGAEQYASLLVSTGAADKHTPWTQIVPLDDGTFSALVPAGQSLFLQVVAFGQTVIEKPLPASSADIALGDLTVPLIGQVAFTVQDESNSPIAAQAFFVPADDDTRTKTAGSLYGVGDTCTPYLGFPHGGSPACNRLLIGLDGHATVDVPMGHYFVYVTAGPFMTLGRQEITVTAGQTQPVNVTLSSLALQPAGTVSADLHVHGAASFDSSIPDRDRVLAFAAARIDVLAATDHDVVYDYREAMQFLGLSNRIIVIPGVETTGHVPYLKVPGSVFPKVIGHWNFWPMHYDPTAPRRGAPDDELMEPGELFARIGLDPAFASSHGIRQLNHPWADSQFGRDLGFPRAIGMNLTQPLPGKDDGTSNGMWIRKPNGAAYRNNDYTSQEVMNSTNNAQHQQYRAFWFYLNNLGEFHTGTANSDSHGLTDDVLGSPRNLVYADTPPTHFDLSTFDDAISAGHVMGTNGPVIEVNLDGQTPSLTPFKPAAGAKLHITVSAAPWVPVQEVRVIVNGQVAKTITDLMKPEDPFGTAGLVRLDTDVALSDLLPAGKDGWIVVEAGSPLPIVGDLDGDGMPDTSDNNGDGKVDKNDVNAGDTTGPLNDPPSPTDPKDPLFHFATVVPGARPQSFTNPLIVDWAGDGFQAPGVGGGR